ncbi:MAG: hypothetical protein SFW65_06945 [Alphaproteobacteria bacterium]|nr:hypothetical protein [Alphaproteobacteria bacterium]
MMSIGKSFLIAVFTLAFFGMAHPVVAESPASVKVDAKIAVPADVKTPAMDEKQPAAKTEPKTETSKPDVKELPKQDPKTVAPPADANAAVKPAEKTKEMLEAEEKAKQLNIKAQAKIDLKNLPKNLSSILPNDNEIFAVAVGETKPIAAARQRKCLLKEAPKWEDTKARLPITDLVQFSDGGVYERDSRRCGGAVPARAVFATGAKVGSERVVIFGSTITVIVKPAEK